MKDKKTNVKKNFSSNQEIRWCPGCGDYAILKTMTQTLSKLNVDPEKTVFISGIGCAARMPYYIETYGFHTIHGRAPSIATGLKLSNPDLDIWVITGDGDALSIGSNHLLHTLRRNINLNIILFNNEIYGLTKGQFSPTSRAGTKSPSSPRGSLGNSINAGLFALGAGGTFIARAIDTDKKNLSSMLESSYYHKGSSLVEIFQNCIVYNDKVFSGFTDKENIADFQIHLENGKPLLFGNNNSKGLKLSKDFKLEVVDSNKHKDEVLIHNEANPVLSQLLLAMEPPEFPMALGIIRKVDQDTYDDQFYASHPSKMKRRKSINDIIRSGDIWKIS